MELQTFLNNHKSKNYPNLPFTHTKIGDVEQNIYPAAYHIPNTDMEEFKQLYYKHIFEENKVEYLTEVQQPTRINIDLDFRYNYEVNKRQHNQQTINDLCELYTETLKKYYEFDKPFSIYVFEKPNVNRVNEKQITKDGIHLVIGIPMDFATQIALREDILKQTEDIFTLPLINTWNDVLDAGISTGKPTGN
jgi:hypothetical protein